MVSLKYLCKISRDPIIEQTTMVKMSLWALLVIYLISNLSPLPPFKTLSMRVPLALRIKISLISMRATLKT
jgi:hypothetical protein